MTLTDALRRVASAGLGRLDAQMLLLLALRRSPHDRAWLLAHDGDVLDAEAKARLDLLVRRRQDGEPMAYLQGNQEFYGLTLQVDPRVLVPRPDTETLVAWAIEQLDARDARTRPARVLDLGTGSGAIALAIKSQRPAAAVFASDASAGALQVAQANAHRLGLEVDFHHGTWLAAVPAEQFDLIVSNPPYIADADPHMAALGHEPRSALTAGPDGLDDLRVIVASAPDALHPGGWLLLEHGHDQAPAVCALLQGAGFTQVGSRDDLAGIARCSGGQWPQAR